jgi:hypothetical protein
VVKVISAVAVRGRARAGSEPGAGVRGQRLRADGLAGLSPADPDVRPRGGVPEVTLERHHAVHVGAGQVELPGQQRHGVLGNVAQFVLEVMQDGQQRAAIVFVLCHEAPHKAGEVFSHPLKVH